ncbi:MULTISPECIES: hypothetical protein [unclassified Devosia]|uniref:hypothetical protein n=1 Tax=unclassified Devosia TaxID=196773 RepID=UPI001551C302|nr:MULTISPECIES: hypothetical protein [unclassified Devosia]
MNPKSDTWSVWRSKVRVGAASALMGLAMFSPTAVLAQVTDKGNPYAHLDVSDDALVAQLDGFRRGFADVNGTRLHYVEGGEGTPVVLMAGWPQT